jgi:deazaflavin-dependent oxidoreductase (nitroreductase family)
MPLRAYHHDAGWLLGHTFMEFTHTGRTTGRRYETVAMVLRYDPDAREAIICAAWGPDTDWVRNLRAAGKATLARGGRTAEITVREVNADEAAPVLKMYVTRVPITRPYFDARPESDLEQFRAEAPRHPVFTITSQP